MGVSPSTAINDSLTLSRWNAAFRGVPCLLKSDYCYFFFLVRIFDIFIKNVNLAGQLQIPKAENHGKIHREFASPFGDRVSSA